jgi:hypothetical protein
MAESKSTTQLVEVEGILNWAKVFEFNRDKNEDFHGEGGAYTVDVLLEKAELDKLTKSGSRLKPKITEEGIAIRFKRKHIHPAGIQELAGPPRVVIGEENPEEFPEDTLIGNGTRAKVFFTVYDTKMGKGTRLEAIQVLDLQEYESDGEPMGGVKLPF